MPRYLSERRAAVSAAATVCTLVLAACTATTETNSSGASRPTSGQASAPTATMTEMSETEPNSIGMRFIALPAGTFLMGAPADAGWAAPAETPQHEVTLTRAFQIGMFEVTQQQWAAVMGFDANTLDRSNTFGDLDGMAERISGDDQPATVSFEDAQQFIQRLNEREGTDVYRLPTEAEWEYAARAGTTTKYSFGDDDTDLDEHAWYGGDFATGSHHPVGQKLPNPWGLYDVHGNVWEWTQDRYTPDGHPDQAQTDPTGAGSGTQRTVRGGSWHSTADGWTSTFRKGYAPDYRGISIGFRLVRDQRS